MNIGSSIRRRRQELRLTQEDLAFRLRIRQAQISAIERGKHNPSLALLERIAEALDTEPRELV